MPRLARFVPLVLAPLLLIAGCSGDPAPTENGPDSSGDPAATEASTEPSPTPIVGEYTASLGEPAAPGPHASLAFPFTDSDGYTYELSAWVVMSEPATDITQSKPGFTEFSYDLTGEVTIVNTTSGRDATLQEPELLRMGPYWENRRGPDDCPIGTVDMFRSGWSSDSEAGIVCAQTARIIDSEYTPGLVIPAGSEITQPLEWSVSTEIPESEADERIATATSPDGWLATMPPSEEDTRDRETTCRIDYTMMLNDNPRAYAATEQLRDCALSSIGTPQVTTLDPAASQAARTRLEAEIAKGNVVDDTSSPYPCPAESVADVTRGTNDIDKVELTKIVTQDLAGNPSIACDGSQVWLELAPRTDANGTLELQAGIQAHSLVGTTAADLYGGKFYAWCIENPGPDYGLQNQCGATWYDDNIVIFGRLAQYEDSTEQERIDRLSRWLGLQVPGIIERLAGES